LQNEADTINSIPAHLSWSKKEKAKEAPKGASFYVWVVFCTFLFPKMWYNKWDSKKERMVASWLSCN
jgi:hypothetical protein